MSRATLESAPRPPAQMYDAALLDLDGVVYRGAEAVKHAATSIAAASAAGAVPVYVTNNASRPPQVVADQLNELGIPTQADHVMTASLAAAAMLRHELPTGSRVLCVGGPGVAQAMESVGFVPVPTAGEDPVAVVQGFGPNVGWHELTEATYAIAAGARFVATNLDSTLPTERGMAVGNGSLVAAVVNATGVTPVSSGKPEAGIFLEAAAMVGAKTPIVVGDRLNTDLAGARAAGYPGLHVLTGVSQVPQLLTAAAHERPTLLALDLRGMLLPHPEVVANDGGGWRCRNAVALSGTHLVREGVGVDLTTLEEITIDELRALCVAAWDAADRGEQVEVSGIEVRVLDPDLDETLAVVAP